MEHRNIGLGVEHFHFDRLQQQVRVVLVAKIALQMLLFRGRLLVSGSKGRF